MKIDNLLTLIRIDTQNFINLKLVELFKNMYHNICYGTIRDEGWPVLRYGFFCMIVKMNARTYYGTIVLLLVCMLGGRMDGGMMKQCVRKLKMARTSLLKMARRYIRAFFSFLLPLSFSFSFSLELPPLLTSYYSPSDTASSCGCSRKA